MNFVECWKDKMKEVGLFIGFSVLILGGIIAGIFWIVQKVAG